MSHMPVSFDGRLNEGAYWEAWVGACLARCNLYTLHHPSVANGDQMWDLSWDLDVFSGTFAAESCPRRKAFGGDEEGWSAEAASPEALGAPTNLSPGALCPMGAARVEVKSNQLTYHGPDDYPFETVLVCAQDSWMKKWPGKETTQRDFLMVSRVTGHIVWVPIGTRVELNHPVHDRNRNYSYKCAVVVREQLRSLKDFVAYVKET